MKHLLEDEIWHCTIEIEPIKKFANFVRKTWKNTKIKTASVHNVHLW